jgi:hypothetical protein
MNTVHTSSSGATETAYTMYILPKWPFGSRNYHHEKMATHVFKKFINTTFSPTLKQIIQHLQSYYGVCGNTGSTITSLLALLSNCAAQ